MGVGVGVVVGGDVGVDAELYATRPLTSARPLGEPSPVWVLAVAPAVVVEPPKNPPMNPPPGKWPMGPGCVGLDATEWKSLEERL